MIQSRVLCDCFEEAYAQCGKAKEVANWLISDCMKMLNRKQMTVDMLSISGKALGKLVSLVADGKVGSANAKKILAVMFEEDIDPDTYAQENGFVISNDTDNIKTVIRNVVASDPKSVADFKSGKEKALMALFGRCMKELKGNCDPQVLRGLLLEIINE